MRPPRPGVSLRALAIAAPAISVSRLAAQSPAAPLGVREVLALREFADRQQVALSPDGRLVAFALRDPARAAALAAEDSSAYFDRAGVPVGAGRGTDVLVADTRTERTRSLTGGRGAAWAPAWSPDGRRLAFYASLDGRARLWVWDREGDAAPRRVSDAVVRPFWGFEPPRWSPDGRQLLVKLLPDGATLESAARLLPDAARRAEGPNAGPTATGGVPGGVSAVVYTTGRVDGRADAAGDSAPRRAAGPTAVTVDGAPSFFNAALGDLALVDLSTGRVCRLARGVRAMAYRFSPDGGRVAFTTRQPDDGSGRIVWDAYDLSVVDTAGGAPRLLAPRVRQEYGLALSWSPDGRRLAYFDGDTLVVRALDGPGAPATRRFARAGLGAAASYRAPLWVADTALVVRAADTLWRASLATGALAAAGAVPGRQLLEVVAAAEAAQLPAAAPPGTVLVVTRDPATKRMGLARVALAGGLAAPLFEADVALGATDLAYQLDAGRDSRTVAYVAERASHPPEVWLAAGGAAPRPLTALHPSVAGRPLGESRLVRWAGARGDTLQGALLLPAGYVPGRRYPLVVKVYGGSRLSNRAHRFGLEAGVDNLQLLAARGYAVLLPDTPLRVGTPATDLAAAVLPGVDAVVALGVADPTRVGLLGHSYGGYSVFALLVRSDRFRAAVSSGGFSNLLSHYGEMRPDGSAVSVGWMERDQGRMGASPWEARERYVENSPFFALDRVQAPVLLLHGGEDRTVPVARAEETFVALRRLGKTAELVEYAGEAHHPGTWRAPNVEDYWARVIAWFDRYLADAGARAAGPAR